MNKQPIEKALDADLRLSVAAMQRAAVRARELARKTGTAIVVSRDGIVEHFQPDAPELEVLSVQEANAPYGDKA
ncbi:MAG: hypothetical protein GC183_07650 [Thiobacillus sp.]|nr:hypothetical protein [Thiobacillus sp.]